jgi:hypothetical protein
MPVDKHLELAKAVKDSGAIDFDKLGEVVKDVAPKLLDNPGVAADDYVLRVAGNVIGAWKVAPSQIGLEAINQLQDMAKQVKGQVKGGP